MAFSSVKQSEFNTIKIFIILKYSIINNSLSKFKFTTGVNARKNMHNSCRKKPVSEAGAGRFVDRGSQAFTGTPELSWGQKLQAEYR